MEAEELGSRFEGAPRRLGRTPRVADETIRRTPHLEVADDPPLRPGTAFDAYVFTDKAPPRPFERSEDVIVAGPARQNRFELTLSVVPSEHFVIRDRGVKRLTIDRGRPDSRRVPFKLSVRKNLRNARGAPSIAVVFFYGHRPAGKVTRYVNVAGISPPIKGAQRQERPDAVAFQGLAKDPELLVIITRAAGDQPYVCFVSSTVLKKFKKPRRKKWGYRNGAEEDVRKRMDRFASAKFDKDVNKRIWALRGAGKALYKDAPENFRQALESLLAGDANSHTILIATEEPVMPWEILVPPRATKPIGATQLVGRWPDPNLLPPRQDIRVSDSYGSPQPIAIRNVNSRTPMMKPSMSAATCTASASPRAPTVCTKSWRPTCRHFCTSSATAPPATSRGRRSISSQTSLSTPRCCSAWG